MMTMKRYVFLLMVIIFITSCKKYEEGPKFTLRTPEKRLETTWATDKISINNQVYDDNIQVTFSKKETPHTDYDGDFNLSENYTIDTVTYNTGLYGFWQLSDDKNTIYLYYSYVNSSFGVGYVTGRDNWIIKKLTKDEFSVDFYYGNIKRHLDFNKQ